VFSDLYQKNKEERKLRKEAYKNKQKELKFVTYQGNIINKNTSTKNKSTKILKRNPRRRKENHERMG
jgi:hypothetical protein